MPDQFQEIRRRKIAKTKEKRRKISKVMKERKEKGRKWRKDGPCAVGVKKGNGEKRERVQKGKKGGEKRDVHVQEVRKEDHDEGIARLLQLVREKTGENLVRPPPRPRRGTEQKYNAWFMKRPSRKLGDQ